MNTRAIGILALFLASSAAAETTYIDGVTPSLASGAWHVGDHLVAPQDHPSVAGQGGSGFSNNGDALNGARTYTYDYGAQPDLTDGACSRGDDGFAMMIWDMGAPFDAMRLYTHQDHYSGGPITDGYVAQDVMEYSVWGSHDGDTFVMLSDVIAFDLDGGGVGFPTYTFAGTEPKFVYRHGSDEFGIVNAYARDYFFSDAYRYFGARTSQISLDASDADPEIDAVAGALVASPTLPATWSKVKTAFR